MNVDKDIDPRFKFHLQLSTAPIQNAITNDEDFAGIVTKHPFFISEGYLDFHPTSSISLRGGRMEEVFADNMRYLWDDDVRFNDFQQVAKLPFNSSNSLEFRAGEYWLSNPNVVILAANSPYVAAGYQVGQKVRDAMLFHPGVALNLSNGGAWKHQLVGEGSDPMVLLGQRWAEVYMKKNPGGRIQVTGVGDGVPEKPPVVLPSILTLLALWLIRCGLISHDLRKPPISK